MALIPACSPCLKLKPVTKGKKSNFLMLNVEPYGGGLWHTWFDRDLSLAGRVLLRAADGSLKHRLVSTQRSKSVQIVLNPTQLTLCTTQG